MILSEPLYGCADVDLMSTCPQCCPALGNHVRPGAELFALQISALSSWRGCRLGIGSPWPIERVEPSTESAHEQLACAGEAAGWRTCFETLDLLWSLQPAG